MSQFSHLFQIFNSGQFRSHLHLRSQDLLNEVRRFIELATNESNTGALEQVLEVIDGRLGVAEEFDLFSFLFCELVYRVPVLEMAHSFCMDMLAQVFCLESLPPLSRGPSVELFHRKLDVAV